MGAEVYDMLGFVTEYSGKAKTYSTGFRREIKKGKPRFDLLTPRNVPYEYTMVYRDAMLASRGAENHAPRNNELACTQEELETFFDSACRHFEQWKAGLVGEDHAAAARWNIRNYEETWWRIENRIGG